MTTGVPELTCRELVELVGAYLDGQLPFEVRTRFELHLCYCDGCRTYLRQLRTVRRGASRLTEETLPAKARDGLLAAFRGWKRGPGGAT